jgi:flagellar hook-associated protein 1 FlgK
VPSTFVGIETALRGLNASQQALQITGHNITNANTPGYTRETANFSTTSALQVAPGLLMGTGVNITSFQRIRDSFLDVQLRAQTMLQGSAQSTSDNLGQVQGVLNEPSDSGLNSLLGAYWGAWQNVANSPEDQATRQALVEAANSLTSGFNSTASQLATIQSQTGQDASLTLQEVNADGQTLQKLNQAIYSAQAVGDTPNDLLDQRDQLLDQLSQLGSVSTTDNGDGTVDVAFDGVTLTAGKTTAYTLSESGGTLSNNMAPTPETATVTASQGKLGALIALRDTTIPGYQSQLDSIASALITSTNGLNQAGWALDGSTNNAFFSGTDASTIGVAATATTIAASSTAAGVPGDNTNALALADLQDSGQASLSGSTIDTAYAQLVTTIGTDAQTAQRNVSNSNVLVNSLTNRRDSVSSVSLDEEMTNLVKFQQGYQAASRALNAIDDALNKLISGTGRVGL